MTDVLNPPLPTLARPRFRTLKVIALAGGVAAARRINAAFAGYDQFGVQMLDIFAPGAASQSLAKPDLVVIDADLSDLGAGPAVERLIAGDLNGAPIVVFADALAPDAARRLMRMGAAEVLDANTPSADVIAAATKAMGTRKNDTSARLSGFFSARGGVGVSTLAVELALALTREGRRQNNVCLIDLNFQFGACASLLNVEAKFNPHAPLEPARVDAQLLEAYLSRHPSGLSVLAAPPSWRAVRVPADGIACLLDVAASQFEHLVIDLPHGLTPVSEAVIANVDDLFVVSDLSVPGTQLLREAVLDLDSRMRSGGQPTIILNRVQRSGRGASLTADDVRRVIKSDRVHAIFEDASVAAEASERGEAILQLAPDSQLAREISTALRSAMPRGAQTDASEPRKSAFFKLMRIR